MSHRSRLAHFVIDVDDLDQGVAFWSAALDAKEEPLSKASSQVYRRLRVPDSEIRILLQRTADSKTGKERMHLDLETDDVDAEVQRLEALGATRYDHQQERGYDFCVLHDPWRNEFWVLQVNFPDLLASRSPRPDAATALYRSRAGLRPACAASPRCAAGRAAFSSSCLSRLHACQCLGRCNHLCVTWQLDLRDELIRRLPESTAAQVLGSAANASQIDGWSDLDLHVDLTTVSGPVDLLAGCQVWAVSEDRSAEQQTLRIVLEDGRRLDLVVKGGVIRRPAQADDNDVRMMAALAAAKLGRGDDLIGLHLTLELIRSSLVQAMLLRDRDLGTNVHRFGSQRDVLAKEIAVLLHNPLGVVPRPNIVEKTVEMYGRWRRELDPGYRPDWSGLGAVISRGLHHQ